MNLHEWALVIFTILGQMAVGSFVVLGVVHFFTLRKTGPEEADQLSDRALLAIGPVIVLALIASLFHLGTPLNAYRALAHVGSSWLSREVLFAGAFTGLGALFAFLQWRKIGTRRLRTVLAWVTALVGLVLVYAMSQVYMLRTIPVWDTPVTPISFFTTTFLLGSLAVGAAYAANYAYLERQGTDSLRVQTNLLYSALRGIAIAAIVLLGVEFLLIPFQFASAITGPEPVLAAFAGVLQANGLLFGIRLALLFLGAGIFGLLLYRYASTRSRTALVGALVYVAFGLVLAGEIVGRYLFYASYGRFGL